MLVLLQKVDNGDRQTNSHAKKHSESERSVQVVHRIKAMYSKIGHQIVGTIHRPVAVQHCSTAPAGGRGVSTRLGLRLAGSAEGGGDKVEATHCNQAAMTTRQHRPPDNMISLTLGYFRYTTSTVQPTSSLASSIPIGIRSTAFFTTVKATVNSSRQTSSKVSPHTLA